ncbi:MAG: hypothetical protein IPO83_13625 [Chitinophagaceae bacterium]|nr:hypothetical protein [Chitinophagaceae bacterium]
MMYRLTTLFPLLLLFCVADTLNLCGQVSQNKRSFQCMDQKTYASYDLLKTTRSYGNYDPQNEWSQLLSSNDIIRKSVELEGGRQYAILLVADNNVEATAIEIRDHYGIQLEYLYKVTELDKGQINLFYTPDADGYYQIYFRVIDGTPGCVFMAVLKGDLDPEFGIDEEEDDHAPK